MTADQLAAVAPVGHRRLLLVVIVVTGLLVATGAWYLSQGEPDVGLGTVWRAVSAASSQDDAGAAHLLIRELRLPRLVLSVLAGATLALAGVIMQDALRNPIADPGLLGIAQSASFMVALTLFFPAALPPLATPALALLAGIGTGVLLVVLARSIRDPVRLTLIGFVLAALFTTMTTIVVLTVPFDDLSAGLPILLRFTVGSVSGSSWERVVSIVPWVVVAIPAALLTGRTLNLLQLGDDAAAGLGMRVTRARLVVLGIAVLLVAPVVAVAGPLAFVALLSPHVARMLLRTTNAYSVLVASAFIGALVVTLADVGGRLLFFPHEIPAGIWTILVVGPIAVLLARSRLRGSASEALSS